MTQTQEMTKVSYRKSRTGEWVVMGPASVVKPGAVTVTKRNGETKTETVVKVGRVFQVDGQDMVYGYLAAHTTARAHSVSRQSRWCDECGELNTPGTRCWETGMVHGS